MKIENADELIILVYEAKHRIVALRSENQILAAQVNVIHIFGRLLDLMPNGQQGCEVDFAWRLEEAAKHLEKQREESLRPRPIPAKPGITPQAADVF